MIRKRIIILWALLAAVSGGIFFSAQQRQAIAATESRIKELQDRRAGLLRDLAQAKRTVSVPTEAARLEATPASKDTGASAPTRAPRPPSLMDIGKDNPQFMNAWISDQRARLQQRYGVLFQNLRLSPSQRDQFKNIVAAQVARSLDISAAAKEQGLAWEDPIIRKLEDDSERQMDAELRGLLGDDGFTAYRQFSESVRLRGFVDGFAVQVAETEPLTAGQAEQLAQALVAASPSPTTDKARDIDPKTVDWRQVDAKAQRILTPAQFSAWQLGVAHNPTGGTRIDQELTKIYEAAKAKDSSALPGGAGAGPTN